MYKYEMDPTRTVGTTERTRDAGRMDRRTDGRTEWNQYTPNNFIVQGGIVTQTWPKFSDDLSKLPQKLGHGRVITAHTKVGRNYLFMP